MAERVLVEESFYYDTPEERCSICSSHITVPYYTNKEDDGDKILYAHKVCWDMPEEMEHEQHPGHTLEKCDVRGRPVKHCSVCGKHDGRDFSYHCSECSDFSLDMVCALKSFPITHVSHPQHPLIPSHDELEVFFCAVCETVSQGISYKCLTCSFHVHQRCVSPRTVNIPNTHHHNLKLIYSINQNPSLTYLYCDDCGKNMKEESLAYHCARCDVLFHAHNCRERARARLYQKEMPELLLLVEESFGSDLPDGCCSYCSSEISIPYYTNKEDYSDYGVERYYFHKVCWYMPNQMEHEQHPGHTLKQRGASDTAGKNCNVCDKLARGNISYHCYDCSDFCIDMVCALKSFRTIHNFHPQHTLIPIHDELEEFLCAACKTICQGISYKCSTCSFQVHQRCVTPQTIKVPTIHRHALELIYSIPQNPSVRSIYCQICQEDMGEQSMAYHCARCRYFIHTHNCRPFVNSGHGHPMYCVEEEEAIRDSESRSCKGCGLKISVPYYECLGKNCESFCLHKSCAELPEKVKNRMHEHALTLSNIVKSKAKEFLCNACHAPWTRFKYYCDDVSCRFNIDIVCAMKTIHSPYEFHQHPLISSHMRTSFPCHACNKDTDGATYQCTTCRFWVHQKCASLLGSKKYDLHPHKLKLTYSLSDSHPSRKHFRCHACRKDMEPDSWAYHCAGCKYFTHVYQCTDPFREIEGFDHEKALEAAASLPVANELVSLATLFFMDTNQEEDNTSEPASHDSRGSKTRQMPFIDPTSHPFFQRLDAPCNHCDLCKCFLGKSLAEVQDLYPSRFDALYSRDAVPKNCCRFDMTRYEKFFDIFDNETRLYITIGSAVLPYFVKHEGHIHVLWTTRMTEQTWCNACEEDFGGEDLALHKYGFRCNICEFTLCMYCAMLPGSIVSHRYDKEHGFKLTYYSIEGVEEYICEICEGDITTMWFYHCAVCDQSIHPSCIWNFGIEYEAFDFNSKKKNFNS